MRFRINSPSTRKWYRKSIGKKIGDVVGCKSEKNSGGGVPERAGKGIYRLLAGVKARSRYWREWGRGKWRKK
ncbi:hypothetical protein Csa_014811 [Cucumis sativus]|uniref:Uncharacterized protein n=1 Tax=Cucumis sativus TaxID=3659 RepID=A0A0A0KU19_CUCSA|nr:hypothetical protein Csa_014811 [Cucumis sativus]